VLQWLRARGCPWNGWVIAQATEFGHTQVLAWARSNGCPEPEVGDDEFW